MRQQFTTYNVNPLTLEQIGQYAPSALATHKHESRSDRYTYIPTIDIADKLMSNGFQVFQVSQCRSRIEGKAEYTKHMIRFRNQALADTAMGLSPEVVLINSHDGTSRYKLFLGIFRMVCMNGAIVGDTVSSVNIMHSGNVLDNVVEGSYRLIEEAPKALNAAHSWGQLQLTDGEQKNFAQVAHQMRFGSKEDGPVPFKPEQLLTPRRSADYGNDLWTVFNKIQENAIRGGLRARSEARTDEDGTFHAARRVRSRAVRGIDQDVKLNRNLWTLAEAMAALKQQ